MSDATSKAREAYERFAAAFPQVVDGFVHHVATWDEQESVGQRISEYLYAEGAKARDAEWRAVVERVRVDVSKDMDPRDIDYALLRNATLNAILAEAPDA